MFNWLRLSICLALVLLVLPACGRVATPSVAQPTPLPAASPTVPEPTPLPVIASTAMVITVAPAATVSLAASAPAASPVVLRGPQVIELASSGRKLSLVVGERFTLKLGPGYVWTLLPYAEQVIAPVPDATLGEGVQGVFQAIGPGETAIMAVGEPLCARDSPPCMMPSIMFELSIEVQ